MKSIKHAVSASRHGQIFTEKLSYGVADWFPPGAPSSRVALPNTLNEASSVSPTIVVAPQPLKFPQTRF